MGSGRITLFVDASWCSGSHYGGWGAWAKRDGWDRGTLFGGAFKTMFTTSTHAELGAIANAISQAWRSGWLHGLSSVMVQSDCMAALAAVRDGVLGTVDNAHSDGLSVDARTSISETEHGRRALDIIRAAVADTGVFVEVRHVKGHARDGSTRSSVNEACDRLARKHMRDRRAAGNPERRAKRRRAKRRARRSGTKLSDQQS